MNKMHILQTNMLFGARHLFLAMRHYKRIANHINPEYIATLSPELSLIHELYVTLRDTSCPQEVYAFVKARAHLYSELYMHYPHSNIDKGVVAILKDVTIPVPECIVKDLAYWTREMFMLISNVFHHTPSMITNEENQLN